MSVAWHLQLLLLSWMCISRSAQLHNSGQRHSILFKTAAEHVRQPGQAHKQVSSWLMQRGRCEQASSMFAVQALT